MKIIPNYNKLLVQQIKLEQNKTDSGLVLPTTLDREAKTQGKIIAVGRDLDRQAMIEGFSSGKYKVGEVVAFGFYAGEKLKVMEKGKEEEYILLEDSEILGWLQ